MSARARISSAARVDEITRSYTDAWESLVEVIDEVDVEEQIRSYVEAWEALMGKSFRSTMTYSS